MKREPKFRTEAALCAAFIAWVTKTRPDVKCFAEWAGWDILLAYPEGWQIGIQAKLRLNAEVILQAAPSQYDFDPEREAPDFRAVLVPDTNMLSAVAGSLGLIVFAARLYENGFLPELRLPRWNGSDGSGDWLDWNPGRRHELPAVPTDSIAGSPCPVSLTSWKLRALDVLAELVVKGSITTKRMRVLGVDPRRWLQNRWLEPVAPGSWIRGDKCPRFDEQHPSAFSAALAKARQESVA